MNAQRGFTLIELIVVVIIVVVLAGSFLSRVPYYQAQAERTAVEQVVAAIQSALVMRYGALMARGAATQNELNDLALGNPIALLQQKPGNYAGEYYDPAPGAIAPGNWMFDLKSRDLIYVVEHAEHFTPGKEGVNWIRFHVRLGYDAAAGRRDAGKELTSIVLEPTESYHWPD